MLVINDYCQDFVDCLTISEFSFAAILRANIKFLLYIHSTLFVSLRITLSNKLLHIEFCLCVISIFRIFCTYWDILNFGSQHILVQQMKFF